MPVPYPVLATKLYVPSPRPGIVRRPRLTARLEEGLRRPLTLVSAPAGFGKTTLLSEWSAARTGPALPLAWLSLDGGDNDPGRFWTYVVSALRTLPGLGGLPAELDAGAPPEVLLAPLINGLDAAAVPFALVLDDYHAITAPAVHTAVGFLVEHMPDGLRLVILTRSDPPWPLARLRANGQMSELRAADLRFTPDEAAEFLTRTMGLDLPTGDVAVLEQRTEGWIAALQMAAISLDGHPDPHGFITAFSGDNRYIADYLAEEVLALQPEPLRRFLLQTSILERVSAPLCRAVTGYDDSRDRLEQVERKGLFLVALDADRRWFRFHHLFADLLRTHLQQAEPDLVPVLHRRAAAWLAGNGLPTEAAEHSLAARDYDRAADLIEQNAGSWWALAQPMYLNLMLKLPAEVTSRRPAFCTQQAWLNCITGRLDAAAALIDAAERNQSRPPDIRSFLALMRTYIAELTGQPYAMTEPVLKAPGYIPEASVAMRNSADVVLAFILYMNGRFTESAEMLVQAAERDLLTRSTNAVPIAVSRLARIRLIEGRVAEAAALCRHYLTAIQPQGEARFWVNGNLHAVLADALLLQGDLEGAEEQAREGVRCNDVWAIPHGIALATQSLARVRFARGDAAGALDLLAHEENATRGRVLPPDLVSERAALRVQAWLAVGDLNSAQRWALESGLTAHDPLSFRRETEHITFARVMLQTGREAEGRAILSRLTAAAAAAGRFGRLAELRSLLRQEESPLAEPLSDREREILELLANGCSNQEIAGRLVVAVGTVKTHVHNIFRKLGAPGRTRALARARELGLIR